MTDWDKMQAYEEATSHDTTPIINVGVAIAEIKKIKAIWPIELAAPETTRIYNNNMPTHDPYRNPNALIYYECGCGAILDPLTKSFASLNNHASEKGWKIRFGETGYTPYCVECGKGVE